MPRVGTCRRKPCSLSGHDNDGPAAFKGRLPGHSHPGVCRDVVGSEALASPIDEGSATSHEITGDGPGPLRIPEASRQAGVEARPELFGRIREDAHVEELELLDDQLEEGGSSLSRLGEGDVEVRPSHPDRDAWKPGSRAEIHGLLSVVREEGHPAQAVQDVPGAKVRAIRGRDDPPRNRVLEEELLIENEARSLG